MIPVASTVSARRRRRSRTPGWARVGVILLGAVLPVTAAGIAAAAPPKPVPVSGPSPLAPVKTATGRPVSATPPKPSTVDRNALTRAPAASWPAAGTADVTATPGRSATAHAGGLTATVASAAARRVRLENLGRAGDGLRLRVSSPGAAAPAEVSLSLDLSGIAGAYGGDYASRLRVVRSPDGAALPTRIDAARRLLATRVTTGAAATTLALTAGASGDTGDYKATSLSPSASWDVSAQTGDFSWSYPIKGPPVPGGLEPNLSIGYSSSEIDGRTASTNNQPSWVGDGHQLWSGYIERAYRGCVDDGVPASGDLCWSADNATLVWNGRSTPLVRDDATATWRSAQDDGTKVERLTGAVNGDEGDGGSAGEHWRLTTTDGAQYYFGLNRLPGWVTGKPTTNSTWTVPVYGNGTGEPCHDTTFATSSCLQAWRWNLDYVVDRHSDGLAYYYAPETNRYLANNATSTGYTRGGTLSRIDYGFRAGQAYAAQAPAQVAFSVADRCVTPGATCTPTTANKGNYPDTPLDRLCSATCTASQNSPTFFSTKKLTAIETRMLSGSAYQPVDSWAFTHTWPIPGDGTDAALFLKTIVHTGLVGGSTALPPVTFDGQPMQNRVDGFEGWAPLNKWRVTSVRSETGGQLEVNYAGVECVRTALPTAQDTNTKRCFAAWWSPPGEGPKLDWFHKYVVRQTLDRDLVGGGRFTQTDYEYVGGGAWHYADADEVSAVSKRTWSGWRGYAEVRVRTGAGDDGPQTETSQRFYRGMDGDKLSSGTRSVTLTDSQGGTHPDSDGLAGFPLETRTFAGVGGAEVSGTITDPWRSRTAAHAHDGRTTSAYLVRIATERERTTLSAGGVRSTRVDTGYDPKGYPKQVDDQGDVSVATDDLCTRPTFASDAARNMYGFPSTSTTVAVRCATTPTYPRDAVEASRTFYDSSTTLGAVPGAGDVTRSESAKSYSGSTPVFIAAEVSTVDAYGRELTSTDVLQRKSVTSYTETGGLTTKTVVTDPASYTTTTTLDPARGLPTASVDANGRRTDLVYDPVGRLASVWLPGRAKATFPTVPNQKFAYSLSTSAAATVTTSSLGPNGTYITSYALFDGLLRPRQTQGPAEAGAGRILTDTTYDTRGLTAKTNAAYVVAGAPGTTLLQVDDNQVPGQTATVYDGAGRPTASVFRAYGAEQWRTTTVYGGDHVDVTPPAGGTATTTFADARGRTTKLLQYRGPTPSGPADTTSYSYTPAGQLAGMTDAAGNRWSYGYDLLGRRTSSSDPDKGATTMAYDDVGQLESATDARGTTLAYKYDDLGRRTGEFLGSTTGTKLAGWTYDTLTGGKGLPTSSTRYVDGQAYTTAVSGYGTDGQPWGKSVTIPATETGLAGTYSYRMVYKSNGQLESETLPATPGLPNESVTYGFDDLGNQTSLVAGQTQYVTGAVYTPLGQPARLTLFSGGSTAWLSSYYDLPTGRLTNTKVEVGNNPVPASDAKYAYDPAGNVKSVADTGDTQCFGYDQQRRLTQAWTPSSGSCAAAPSVAGLGGPAPYWQSFGYDVAGNRTSLVSHAAAGDTTTTYTYPAPATAQPHTVRSATVSGPGVSRIDSWSYDATGNTSGRTVAGSAKTLTWDVEGRLASVTGGVSMLYDADGSRLIRRDGSGSTLYLPDGVEVHVDPAGANATSTRYYSFGGETVAVRTAAGLSFLGSDRHDTAFVSVNAVSGAASVRRVDPFGNPRGSVPSWPDERGFVNGVSDSTGFTHLGAREYDPAIGRFVSVDPILDPSDPQQLNGFAYANNNPTTFADPDGLLCTNGPDGMCHTPSGKNVPTPGVSDVVIDHRSHQQSGKPSSGGGSYSPSKRVNTACSVCGNFKPYRPKQSGPACSVCGNSPPPQLSTAATCEGAGRGSLGCWAYFVGKAFSQSVSMTAAAVVAPALDAVSCATTGSFGACTSTAINAALTVAGVGLGKAASRAASAAKAAKRVTISGPKDFDPTVLRGKSADAVRASIPEDWVSVKSSSGGGEVFRDPSNYGRQIRIMPGYPPGSRPDLITTGPYVVVSQKSVTVKIPLYGNPTLP